MDSHGFEFEDVSTNLQEYENDNFQDVNHNLEPLLDVKECFTRRLVHQSHSYLTDKDTEYMELFDICNMSGVPI